MKARLKTLLDKPKGIAWPSPARAVKCPVKSGKQLTQLINQQVLTGV